MAQISPENVKPLIIMSVVFLAVAGAILATPWVGLVATLFCIICFFMCLIVLIQRPKGGGGLAGAFGGAGAGAQGAFGARTGDWLTLVTTGFFVLFLLAAMKLTWALRPVTATAASPGDESDPTEMATPDEEGQTPPPPSITTEPVTPPTDAPLLPATPGEPEPAPDAPEPDDAEPDDAEPDAAEPDADTAVDAESQAPETPETPEPTP